MITIRLFCAGGASTSLLAEKMRKAAAERGLEVNVTFGGVHRLEMMQMEELEQADVALLGPQVGFTKGLVEDKCKEAGAPLEVIPMRAYGLCDGAAVIDLALKLIEENEKLC